MSILSPAYKKLTKKGFKTGSFWHGHPFEWNEELNELEVTPNWKKLALWRLNWTLTVLYVSFVAVRAFQVNWSEDSEFSPTVKIYVLYIFLVYSFNVFAQYTLVTRKEDLLLFYKQTFTLSDQLSAHFNEENEVGDGDGGFGMPKIFDLGLQLLWYMFCAICVGFGILNLVIPNSPDMISSVLLPRSGILRWILLVPCALFQFNFVMVYVANGLMFLTVFCAYVFSAVITLKQVKRGLLAEHTRNQKRNGHQNRSISGQKIKKMLQIYRQVGVLQEFFHQLACTVLFPVLKVLMMLWVVFGIHGFIRMEGFISVFLGLMSCSFIVQLTIVTASCAEVHDNSNTILHLLTTFEIQQCLNEYEGKLCESFRLIQIRMRSSYVIDRMTVITVVQIVMDNTINMLVSGSLL